MNTTDNTVDTIAVDTTAVATTAVATTAVAITANIATDKFDDARVCITEYIDKCVAKGKTADDIYRTVQIIYTDLTDTCMPWWVAKLITETYIDAKYWIQPWKITEFLPHNYCEHNQ